MRSSLAAMLARADSAVFLARCGEEVQGVATVTTPVGIEFGLAAEMESVRLAPGTGPRYCECPRRGRVCLVSRTGVFDGAGYGDAGRRGCARLGRLLPAATFLQYGPSDPRAESVPAMSLAGKRP
jgi:hypothetical protein